MPLTQLKGCDLKLGRARFHQASLFEAFVEWVPKNMSLSFQPNASPQAVVPWRLQIDAEVPREFALPLGDFLQCARAALDYLIYELAILNGTPKPEGTQFPISTDASRYFQTGRKQVRLLNPRHRQVIRRLQPYKTDNPEIHPLAILNRLSNTDKHRLLHVVQSGMTYFSVAPGGGTLGFVISRYGQSEAFKAARANPNAGAILQVDLTLDDRSLSVLAATNVILDRVESIIDWFRPVFAEKA